MHFDWWLKRKFTWASFAVASSTTTAPRRAAVAKAGHSLNRSAIRATPTLTAPRPWWTCARLVCAWSRPFCVDTFCHTDHTSSTGSVCKPDPLACEHWPSDYASDSSCWTPCHMSHRAGSSFDVVSHGSLTRVRLDTFYRRTRTGLSPHFISNLLTS